MTILLDSNVIVRHLTQDPPDQGKAATSFLTSVDGLLLVDVIAAEVVYVLQSFYRATKPAICTALRALIAMPTVATENRRIMFRSCALYEQTNLDFADAYLTAYAEHHNITEIASFDKGVGKNSASRRIDPLHASGKDR
ncbi:MAG: PIN domain-containing protein [Propionibacteriaceae bacterium]|nr:PIN domain-containing protein [Propionibacteriaceae bacterium]